MTFDGPFTLGPFSIDAEGRLAPARPDLSPGFSVRWRGRVIHARLSQRDSRDGRLRLRSTLGRVPSTAVDPTARTVCLRAISALPPTLPEVWTVRLLPDHRPQLEAETTVALPITVSTLVTEMTAFLLELSPYLDILDEAGVGLVRESDSPLPEGG